MLFWAKRFIIGKAMNNKRMKKCLIMVTEIGTEMIFWVFYGGKLIKYYYVELYIYLGI